MAAPGPRFYLRHKELIEAVNRGRFAIVQVMSGRSEDNRLFQSNGLEYLIDRASGERLWPTMHIGGCWRTCRSGGSTPVARAVRMFHAPEEVRDVLQETRENWLASYRALFAEITVPIVLLVVLQTPTGP